MPFTPAPWPRKLRSQEWWGGTSRDNIYHRGWMKNQGYPHDMFDGRPVIGILNTWSELTTCNAHLHDLAARVKHGIYEAGGFPVEVPVFSTAESSFRPTAMMFRNLAAMAVEDAVVLAELVAGGVPPGGIGAAWQARRFQRACHIQNASLAIGEYEQGRRPDLDLFATLAQARARAVEPI